ncbi:uncharacterized protein [Diabrotica undecimpunctata]|uniref:uncharacterized protein n=1 Tax=Diabrotica undecimpunctata TaxID=50387 RepID=UPI003B63BBA9
MFASSTLSSSEKKYSNLEREALAIMFALNKFHKYLYGRKFILITDHQPLQFIFGKNKGIPISAAARITRWAITLSGYQYDIQYKKGAAINNADGVSRLPCSDNTKITDYLYSFSLVDQMPLNACHIANETNKDLLLLKVKDFILSGWPRKVSDESLKPYFKRRNELSIEQNCILVGNRVVIPNQLQDKVLDLFHEPHNGIVRTKMLKSKWLDVKLMSNGTEASESISKLRDMFTVIGLPVELVSDNGPPFNSSEFVAFCQANGIKPLKTPPYHPQICSNGVIKFTHANDMRKDRGEDRIPDSNDAQAEPPIVSDDVPVLRDSVTIEIPVNPNLKNEPIQLEPKEPIPSSSQEETNTSIPSDETSNDCNIRTRSGRLVKATIKLDL